MPMRIADADGIMIAIYEANESDQAYPFAPNTLLENALGYCGGTHCDVLKLAVLRV